MGLGGLQAREDEGAAGDPPGPRLGSVSNGRSRSSSGAGKARAGSAVPKQSRSPGVPGTRPPLSLSPWPSAELVLSLPAASPIAAACQEPRVQAEVPPPSPFIP